jgi:hypothetical protein
MRRRGNEGMRQQVSEVVGDLLTRYSLTHYLVTLSEGTWVKGGGSRGDM